MKAPIRYQRTAFSEHQSSWLRGYSGSQISNKASSVCAGYPLPSSFHARMKKRTRSAFSQSAGWGPSNGWDERVTHIQHVDDLAFSTRVCHCLGNEIRGQEALIANRWPVLRVFKTGWFLWVRAATVLALRPTKMPPLGPCPASELSLGSPDWQSCIDVETPNETFLICVSMPNERFLPQPHNSMS